MSDATDVSLFDPRAWMRAWMSWSGAPQNLVQPILPGWSFGNITVNEENSSSPATEQEILKTASYGKQLGRLMDAVGVLVDRAQARADDPAFGPFQDLRREIDSVKNAQIEKGVEQLSRELTQLADRDKALYDKMIAKLEAVLRSQPTAGSVQ